MRRTPLLLLFEASLDKLADRIAASFIKGVRGKLRRTMTVDGSKLPNGIGKLTIKMSSSRSQPGIAVKGSFDHSSRDIQILVQVSPDFSPRDHKELEAELREKLRHEFEHSDQPASKLHNAPEAARPDDVSSIVDYYTDPAEAEAHVAGFKAHAKERGVSVREVIDARIKKIRHFALKKGSAQDKVDSALAKVKRAWLRRV